MVIDPNNDFDINTYACCKAGAQGRDNDLLQACIGKIAGYVWEDDICKEVQRDSTPGPDNKPLPDLPVNRHDFCCRWANTRGDTDLDGACPDF